MKSSLASLIQEKLEGLVVARAAPGFQLALGFKNECLGVFSAGVSDLKSKSKVSASTLFDLSSLTKILVTVELILEALQNKKILNLKEPLRSYFPSFRSELKNRSLIDLLEHRAGLPPIFAHTEMYKGPDENRDEKLRFFLEMVDSHYQAHESQLPTLYSDVGFMLLGLVLESLYGKRLKQIYTHRENLVFGPLPERRFLRGKTLATLLSLDPVPKVLKGRVQDPRADWLGGDAGHAGLFGSATAIENWGRELFMSYHGKGIRLGDQVVRSTLTFKNRSGPYIAGFDTPSRGGKVSQAGNLFSETTIGHLGYTGVSFWMDIEQGFRVTLLSHRFAEGFDSERLARLRPTFHDWLHREIFSKIVE